MTKRKLLLGSILLGTGIFITSCSWSLEVTQSNRKSEEAASRNIVGVGVVQIPTVTDLEVESERKTFPYSITVVSKRLAEEEQKLLESRFKKKDFEAAKKELETVNSEKKEDVLSILYAIKQIAKSKMLINFGGDILIDPRYSIEIENNEKISIVVSGFIGRYKNFRNMQPKDTALLRCPIFWINNTDKMPGTIEVTR